ncbi:MAG TPA: sigma-54 dependent transcriptional regulator [Pyrinomonadaceae bacterium]|nr:sigma-54 dependent transcriptional regulator [Pyrinomonadaceae bacterium]
MKKELKALIVDDDDLTRHSISSVFRADEWTVHETKLDAEAIQLMSSGEWNVVVHELAPEKNYGFKLLAAMGQDCPNTKVILTTSRPSAVDALDAIALGAFEYLPKPCEVNDVRLLLRRLRERFKNDRLRSGTDSEQVLVGRSDSLIAAMRDAGRVAATSLPVLLTGESGTGKEVIASMLHKRSSRSGGPFIAVNCSAIPAALIESELFGHEKGSFTGADRDRPGLWEEAAGGTILLDEITETSLSFQVKLLRVIQRGEVRRVGSNQTRHLDVRVIAASNRDVEQEVNAGTFRRDLFHRLNAVSIRLPSLRERKEDIPLLIEAFEQRVSAQRKLRFSPEVLDIFHRYPWPGNVRELEHVVMRCVAMCDGIVLVQDLPDSIRNHRDSSDQIWSLDVVAAEIPDWPELATMEGAYVAKVLAHTGWNKQAAARMLNIDRKTLDRMIKRHKIIQPIKNSNHKMNARAA